MGRWGCGLPGIGALDRGVRGLFRAGDAHQSIRRVRNHFVARNESEDGALWLDTRALWRWRHLLPSQSNPFRNGASGGTCVLRSGDGKRFHPLSAQTVSGDSARRDQGTARVFCRHPDSCQKTDDPCDPESFDSSIEGKIITGDRGHAAAFVVSYEKEGFGQDEKKMEYRELLWSDVKARVGDVPLERLVEPEMLEKIFAAKPASAAP